MGNREIDSFLEKWVEGTKLRESFTKILTVIQSLPETDFSFISRPGVSYSLRPKCRQQTDRALFVMVDIIDDDPADRWLSVCFYEDMITDPEGLGECIPGGLAGNDGYCFDLNSPDSSRLSYIIARIQEAWTAAGGQEKLPS